MGWDVKRGRRYYSRSIKVAGRVVRTYVGGGAAGEAAAAADALRRANRRAALEARLAAEARLDEASGPVIGLHRLCGLVVHAALARGGFHRHGGEWRKTMTADTRAATAAHPMDVQMPSQAEVDAVLRAAMRGDRAALPRLTWLLDRSPDLWRRCGDLAHQAQEAWIGLAAGRDLLYRESIRRQAAAMRAELAGPDAPPLERLLADRVVACWIQMSYCDAAYAQGKAPTFAQDAAAQRRQSTAQTRYLQSIKQLAVVRKLLRLIPSAVDLLRFPVNERDAGSRAGVRRSVPAAQPVGN